ncbi:MAG: glycosyltransferase family 2 protein [Candidatus Shapirobacteria bacterium]
MSNISIILLTKNEQENLLVWKNWITKLNRVNEIIVIDSNSTDNTKKILKSFETKNLSIKIFDRELDGNYALQRNFAVKQTNNDWVLFLDTDETPSSKLLNYINNTILNDQFCYSIKRYLVYANHILYHGVSATDYTIRLFNKNFGKFTGPVHETWSTKNKIIKINEPLFHNSAPNLKIFLSKLNKYSTIRAKELFDQKKKPSLLHIIIYPKAKFVQYYLYHLGFLDGIPGLTICLAMSFYSFLVRAKLWHLYHT